MRKNAPILAAATVLGFVLVMGCQQSSTGQSAKAGGDAVHGKLLFEATCATCHAADGTGVKGLGKSLVASEFVRKSSDTVLIGMITEGREAGDPLNTTKIAMPPKGGNAALSESDIRDIVGHLRKLNAG